jgi:vacuolar-type H+-ATPase subunit I/STV1
MNGYQVVVNGKNFLVEVDSCLTKLGFFINVYVQAESRHQAEFAAMEQLMQYEGLRNYVRNTKEDPPAMYADEIKEIRNYTQIDQKIEEIAWYSEIKNSS